MDAETLMPLFADNLQGKGEKGTLNWHGETLNFTYNPNAISHKERRRLRQMVTAAETAAELSPETDWMVIYLHRMLVSWDMYATKEDLKAKKVMPITEATIDGLPDALLIALTTRIGELINPPVSGTGSGGSFTAADETGAASAPTGTSMG